MERIKHVFDRDFLQWRIKLPAEAIETQQRGEIWAEGWHIQYLFGENARGKFMDYLAGHHMQGAPDHKRIYETGESEGLPSYMEGTIHPADSTKTDDEKIVNAYHQYNRKVGKLMILKGFDKPGYWVDEEGLQYEEQTNRAIDEYFKLIEQIRNEIAQRKSSLFDVG